MTTQTTSGSSVRCSDGFGGWLPIETVPLDGTEVALLFAAEGEFFGQRVPRVRAGSWRGDWSIPYYRTNAPIAWQPMPAPPNASLSGLSAAGENHD